MWGLAVNELQSGNDWQNGNSVGPVDLVKRPVKGFIEHRDAREVAHDFPLAVFPRFLSQRKTLL